MKQTSPSVFDDQFLASISPRRLNLMPLMLKLYVGFYTVSGAVALFRAFYGLLRLLSNEGVIDSIAIMLFFGKHTFSVLRGAAALSMWQEKRWAVQAAFIVSVMSVGISLFLYVPQVFMTELDSGLPAGLFSVALEIPYIFLLTTIMRDWKHKALSGKEIAARKTEIANS